MIFETPYVATVANKQVQATIYHRLPAASIQKWSSMPRYDGKAFRAATSYDNEEDFLHFVRVLQGGVDLMDMGLHPADRPQEAFPSITTSGRPNNIAHATWWTAESGALFVWSDAYDSEEIGTRAAIRDSGWHSLTLPQEVAHWAVGRTTPIIASPDERLLQSILAQLPDTYCGRSLKQA